MSSVPPSNNNPTKEAINTAKKLLNEVGVLGARAVSVLYRAIVRTQNGEVDYMHLIQLIAEYTAQVEDHNKDDYSKDGFNQEGYNRAGFNREGYDRDGFAKDGYDRNGLDINKVDRYGFDLDGFRPYDEPLDWFKFLCS
jgi:ribosomal protein S15P/S13E